MTLKLSFINLLMCLCLSVSAPFGPTQTCLLSPKGGDMYKYECPPSCLLRCPWTATPSIELFVYPWTPLQCNVCLSQDLLSDVMFVCPWTPYQSRCLLRPWTSCLSMKQLPEHGLCSIPTLFSTNVAQELYIRIYHIFI
jgi:hypothetical protein